MKHSLKITLVLLSMFFLAQLIGLLVISLYSPQAISSLDENGNVINKNVYNMPYGLEPPEGLNPKSSLISIIISIVLAVLIMFALMRFGATFFLRAWFFFVIVLALGITLNAFFLKIPYSSLFVILIAIPLAYLRVFKRNILVHNFTELLIYPGIASIFVPLLNIWTMCLLLIFISLYDMYAVWHAKFMQKMAKYQIKTLRVFSGFFIPYLGKKERDLLNKSQRSSKIKSSKIKVNVAILGGGDIVFPIILSGVILHTMGIIPAILISLGATIALGFLFYISKKGKFYPAMPFITLGCFIALIISYIFFN